MRSRKDTASGHGRRAASATLAVGAAALLALSACSSSGGGNTSAATGGAPAPAGNSAQPPATGGGGNNGSSTPDTVAAVLAKFNNMSGSAREQGLLAMAKKEGSLTVYGSIDTDQPLVKAFEDKYGIKVNFYGADSSSLDSRLQQEQAAHHYTDDVFAVEATDLEVNKKYFADYNSPWRKQIPSQYLGSTWTPVRIKPFVTGYNTNLLNPSDLPKSWDGFADPKWKGKLAIVQGDFDWYSGVFNYLKSTGKSDAQVTQIMDAIAANSRLIDGHTTASGDLASGQFSVALNAYNDTIDKFAKQGAPVTFGGHGKPAVQPIIAVTSGVGLVSTAPHPAAAMLYIDFLFSSEAAKVYEEASSLPILGGKNDELAGLKVWPVNVISLVNEQKKWVSMETAFEHHAGGV